jgi:hypothetical protein
MRRNGQTSEYPSEWQRFLTFAPANPDVPIVIWFYGILLKALTLIWLGYGVTRGVIILADHGPPEAFLLVMFQLLAATILYFLGDGLCHGEKNSIYGLTTLCAVTIIVAIYALKFGYHIEMRVLTGAIFLLFVPPIFSGFKNISLFH